MTPQELYEAIDAARRERGLKRWQVHVALDVDRGVLDRMRRGHVSPGVRARALAWLERRQAPPREE